MSGHVQQSQNDPVANEKSLNVEKIDVEKGDHYNEEMPTKNLAKEEEEEEEEEEAEEGEGVKKEKEGIMSSTHIFYQNHRILFHLLYFIAMTAFVIAAFTLQVPKGYSKENLVLGLIWAFISLKLLFYHVSYTIVTQPIASVWMTVVYNPFMKLKEPIRYAISTLVVAAIILITVLVSPENPEIGSTRPQRLISLFGMVVFLGLIYGLSNNRRAVQWRTVLTGILLQFLLALFVLRTNLGYSIFNWIAALANTYLGFSYNGFKFLFGPLPANNFVIAVLPAVLFFCATVQVLYYLGALQWLVLKIAAFFFAVMGTSGAESVVAAASPFVGQGESALLIRPFVPYMTMSEIHQIMTSGFATVSGSTLYGYAKLGVDLQSLLTAAIMSIPCSLAISKLRYPETEESLTKGKLEIPKREEEESNVLHAAGNGAAIGLTIIGLIAASLLAIISLLAAFDAFLTWLGLFVNIPNLSTQLIIGYILVPVAWLMGVPSQDVVSVGRLLAEKLIVNEFAAYIDFTDEKSGYVNMAYRSKVITTYALAGFANLGSVGIQIGVLGSMAPGRRGDIAKLAISAMLCGALSTCFSASIAGMLL